MPNIFTLHQSVILCTPYCIYTGCFIYYYVLLIDLNMPTRKNFILFNIQKWPLENSPSSLFVLGDQNEDARMGKGWKG